MNKCGIYVIINLINKKFYIGSSINIGKRVIRHKCDLNRRVHDNKHLQAAWIKYGKDSFKFDILKECSPSELKKLEQIYLDEYQCYIPEIGYNMCRNAENVTGRKHSKESIEIIRLKNIQNCPLRKPIIIDEIQYQSVTDASKIIGIGRKTIEYRCRSKNFNNYKYESQIERIF